jgi:hypothetical protein
MDPKALKRIERSNYLLGAAFIGAVAVLGDQPQLLGAAVGAVLQALNFSVVRRIVDKVLAAPDGKKSRPTLVFVPKMMALMAAVALAIYFLPLSAVMLAAGFSLFMVSIAIETVRFATRPPVDPSADDSHHDEDH